MADCPNLISRETHPSGAVLVRCKLLDDALGIGANARINKKLCADCHDGSKANEFVVRSFRNRLPALLSAEHRVRVQIDVALSGIESRAGAETKIAALVEAVERGVPAATVNAAIEARGLTTEAEEFLARRREGVSGVTHA